MTNAEAFETALSIVALHAEGRTADMQALTGTLNAQERGHVFGCLVAIGSQFARLLMLFNGRDNAEVTPEWLRALAGDAYDIGTER